jgi:hypothetical protein
MTARPPEVDPAITVLAIVDDPLVPPVLFAIGCLLVYGGFRQYRTKRLIEDTPTETIRSMAAGRTEVTGTARAHDGAMDAPFTEGKALCATYEIEEYEYDDDGSDWVTVASGTVAVPFEVDDGTGVVIVDADERVELHVSEENRTTVHVGAGEAEPEAIRNFLTRHADSGVDGIDVGGSPLEIVDEVDDTLDTASGSGFSGATTGGFAGRSGGNVGVATGHAGGGVVEAVVGDRRRYTQEIIPPGAKIYCFGNASEPDLSEGPSENGARDDAGEGTDEQRLVIGHDATTDRFVVSDMTEKTLTAELGRWAPISVAVGVGLMTAGFALGISMVGIV